MFPIKIVVIICAKVTKWDAILQHMVNSNQHGVSDRNSRTVFTPSGSGTLVLGRKVRTLKLPEGVFDMTTAVHGIYEESKSPAKPET